MSERLTDEELAKLERLREFACLLPWRVDTNDEGEARAVITVPADPDNDTQIVVAECWDEHDAAYIATAMSALPSLLAEVRASRAAPRAPGEEKLREAVRAWADKYLNGKGYANMRLYEILASSSSTPATCAYCEKRSATHVARHGAKLYRPACDECDPPASAATGTPDARAPAPGEERRRALEEAAQITHVSQDNCICRTEDVACEACLEASRIEGRIRALASSSSAPAAAPHFFDKRAADALAREVQALIDRKVIDSRSLAADALLDYVALGPTESVPEKLATSAPATSHAAGMGVEKESDRE